MNTTPPANADGLFAALQTLTFAEVEKRLADLAAEQAALTVIRRSIILRNRVKRRRLPPLDRGGGVRRDG
jgi:hypothetical protein